MPRWTEPADIAIPDELIGLAGGSRLAAKELVRRGFADLESARAFIDPDFYRPCPAQALPGMDQAVDRLAAALKKGERILVWGDFDVDGQTATAILVETLRELGGSVGYHVPIRADESHGISLTVLQRILEDPDEAPNVILTCDTGISAFDSLEYARSRQVDVIVTDHHEFARQAEISGGEVRLPPALCIVTPRSLPSGHALEGLPGAGVAYKLVEALFHRFGDAAQAEKQLDLAALGIVADVARQTDDTRYLLQRGLQRLNLNQRVGLAAILERAGLTPGSITEEQIGFTIAPRLNALGRLSDANPAVELLTTRDASLARHIALELEGWNVRRQLLTGQVLRGALAKIEQDSSFADRPVLLLAHEGWEAGVIGIVASRLVETYGKPALLISIGPDGIGRGSARSVDGVDITEAISRQADCLRGFGGHRMAAGFSIEQEKIPIFEKGIERAVSDQMAGKDQKAVELAISAFIKWSEIGLDTARALELLAPFGHGNPPVVMASEGLSLRGISAFGKQQEHLRLSVEDDSGINRSVIWWGGGELGANDRLPQGKFRLAYTLRAGNLRGKPELNIVLEDIDQPAETASTSADRAGEVYSDFRASLAPLNELIQILKKHPAEELQIWAEGEPYETLREALMKRGADPKSISLHGRDELIKCKMLVLWTPPPGRSELIQGLKTASPECVFIFNNDPGADEILTFIRRLSGLVKHILSAQAGSIDLTRLASRMAHTEQLVMVGLYWLAARGFIAFVQDETCSSDVPGVDRGAGSWLKITAGGIGEPDQADFLEKQLRIGLQEACAFRSFYQRLDFKQDL